MEEKGPNRYVLLTMPMWRTSTKLKITISSLKSTFSSSSTPTPRSFWPPIYSSLFCIRTSTRIVIFHHGTQKENESHYSTLLSKPRTDSDLSTLRSTTKNSTARRPKASWVRACRVFPPTTTWPKRSQMCPLRTTTRNTKSRRIRK